MDVDWLVDEVVAALGDADTSFTVCSDGRLVSDQVASVAKHGGNYDLVIADLQIGSMGGVAVTMALRLDASSGRLPACRCCCCSTASPTSTSPSAAVPMGG